jgi:hypothetical protein
MAIMTPTETSAEVKAKIILDEANLAFTEAAERKDKPGARTLDGSAWDDGKMEGEYDERDFRKILELQLKAARICDDNPDLERTTADMFQSVTAENAGGVLKKIAENPDIMELARISVTLFMMRFPTAHAFMTKGHPLVMASDEFMLENSASRHWYDYSNIARDFGWA